MGQLLGQSGQAQQPAAQPQLNLAPAAQQQSVIRPTAMTVPEYMLQDIARAQAIKNGQLPPTAMQ